MTTHNKLILVWSLSLTIIGISAALRIPYLVEKQETKVEENVAKSADDPLIVDKSFYTDSTVNSKVDVKNTTLAPTEPIITAKAYLAGNLETKEIFFEKNSKLVLPVASMSKLITAFVITDMLPLDTKITITEEEFNVASDTSKIAVGEIYTIGELLEPLLMNSSNVAAEALASSSDRSEFIKSMESYAWEVGMPNTKFADPSGLSPNNVSTARDFFALAQYLFKSRADILRVTKIADSSISTTTEHGYHKFTNIHPFVKDPNYLGGKTGHTLEAKDTMLTIMNIDEQPIAIIVMSSDNRRRDTALIIEKVRKYLSQ